VVCGVTRLSLSRVTRAVMPFLAVELAVLLLVTYFPDLILAIPRLFDYVR
jgi:C4-dicarboxylate transporter DctM subunit